MRSRVRPQLILWGLLELAHAFIQARHLFLPISQPLDVGSLQRAGVTLGRICLFSSMKFLEQDLAKRFELPTFPPPGTMTTLGLRRRTELRMQ